MSNILAAIKAGAYCTAACFPPTTVFAPVHYVRYLYQHLLPLNVFSILRKNMIVSKHRQIDVLIDDDSIL